MTILQALTSDTVVSINVGVLITLAGMIISGIVAIIKFNNRIKDTENGVANALERINDYKEGSAKKISDIKDDFKDYVDRVEKNSKTFYGQLSDEIKDLKTFIEEQNQALNKLDTKVQVLIEKSK